MMVTYDHVRTAARGQEFKQLSYGVQCVQELHGHIQAEKDRCDTSLSAIQSVREIKTLLSDLLALCQVQQRNRGLMP